MLHGPRAHVARKVGEEAVEVLLAEPGSHDAGRPRSPTSGSTRCCCWRATASTRWSRSTCCWRAAAERTDPGSGTCGMPISDELRALLGDPRRRRCCGSGPSGSSQADHDLQRGRHAGGLVAGDGARPGPRAADTLAFSRAPRQGGARARRRARDDGGGLLPRVVGRGRHRRRRVAPGAWSYTERRGHRSMVLHICRWDGEVVEVRTSAEGLSRLIRRLSEAQREWTRRAARSTAASSSAPPP